LLREGEPIGAFGLSRSRVEPFTEREVELVRTFASQAVIAIENTRLLKELHARTDDLSESLQQQTATADVLKVISRSAFDLKAVLDTLVESAASLCTADTAIIFVRDGEVFRAGSTFGADPQFLEALKSYTRKAGRDSIAARVILSGAVEQIPDVYEDKEYHVPAAAFVPKQRALIGVPLLRDGRVEGVFALIRNVPGLFAPREVALLQTFADQAVIALQNVRLFEEVQARTSELSESLQQQTATADVLKVISRSAFDLDSVLSTLVESAAKLCEAEKGVIFLREESQYCMAYNYGFSPEFEAYAKAHPLPEDGASSTARAGQTGVPVQAVNIATDDQRMNEVAREYRRLGEYRTNLGVPLRREGQTIGVFTLTRQEAREFTARQIELVQTFADQAVIAIQNVRLFDEVQARTSELSESLQQQTATADVLKVISRSTFDLQTVLHTLVESAAKLTEADKATITRQRDGVFYRAESYGFSDEFMNYVRTVPVVPDRGSASGRALLEGTVVHIPDVKADTDYTFNEAQRLGDFRAILAVPMLREGSPVGVIVLTRTEPRAFTDKQIELVTTFADQAAIAIENVRLFDQVQAQTQELTQSLDDLRTAQDRLVQTEKLASLGQLTAGIAHEIKNPLNFVNNFSALSAELIDELLEVLGSTNLPGKAKEEVEELTHMLKGNLEKVVQHGKRADSIVKNMLLHSREGSGEHRPVDINAVVDESLNLAYHGARAEKSGFNITLERKLDPDAGLVDIYPQEMTRVFLNLISNGFYAATKRKASAGDGFEPTLTASTKNLGNAVEVRIRDNGTGIPPEVKEKMFNPFFTTKPAGEGTGLGLSMSHDIVVKQHGGRMDVATEPDVFTEFIITLPRAAAAMQSGSRT
jgi:GAF domain-containing protein